MAGARTSIDNLLLHRIRLGIRETAIAINYSVVGVVISRHTPLVTVPQQQRGGCTSAVDVGE